MLDESRSALRHDQASLRGFRTSAAWHYDGPGFHDLRRTSATALVVDGVDVKTAQYRLGHSSPVLTLAIYAQAVTSAERDAADRIGSRLMGAG